MELQGQSLRNLAGQPAPSAARLVHLWLETCLQAVTLFIFKVMSLGLIYILNPEYSEWVEVLASVTSSENLSNN